MTIQSARFRKLFKGRPSLSHYNARLAGKAAISARLLDRTFLAHCQPSKR
jgi:hypothetical protein